VHGLRERVSATVIAVGRAMFANTPVQRWPITTRLYRAVFAAGHPGDELVIAFRGVELVAPNRDVSIVPGLAGGFYEKLELDIFQTLVARSRAILDVGANIGLYSCLAARDAPAGARIVAFEPISDNVGYLRRNLAAAQDGTSRVRVETVAVGDRTGTVSIYTVEGGASIGTHSVSARNASGSTTAVQVPMVSLDDYVADRGLTDVDLVKVDVEGFEVAVLAGSAGLLAEQHPTLFIEYLPERLANCGADPEELVTTICRTYDSVYAIDERRRAVTRCRAETLLRPGPGRPSGANLVAVHSGTHPEHQERIEAIATGPVGQRDRRPVR
jgi:FkbM family methyltransferase